MANTITEIQNKPHGPAARKAAHWLAVEVMEYQLREGYWWGELEGKGNGYDGLYKESEWDPFTDANHTRMLVQKYGFFTEYGAARVGYNGGSVVLQPYHENPALDATSVLYCLFFDGVLTLEEIESWTLPV